MCGRYAISTSRLARIENALGIELPEVQPHYNIAPTQTVPVVRTNEVGGYELVNMRWGLIPGWSKEPRTSYATFNARAETVAEKPTFRAAYRSRRCLVPASSFYEWRDEQGRKQPWYFSAADGQELAFAGLWEEWHGPDAPPFSRAPSLSAPRTTWSNRSTTEWSSSSIPRTTQPGSIRSRLVAALTTSCGPAPLNQ
jgi:putative SOS response-associated peptidase YedK